jgi:LmbE family N-acetylglucosaminyl deacetylase
MPPFLYLSPHFDDAALSCGGLLLANAGRGERAVVLTVCAGTPDYGNLPKFAKVQHRQWGNPSDPIATRRAEDQEAARRLGVSTQYLDVLDCIYRRDARGRPVVFSNHSLFGPARPDEQPVVQRIAQELLARVRRRSETRILAPLAAGRHVDHQLVRDAARMVLGLGYNVAWYEDFPYAGTRGAVTRARRAFEGNGWECAVFPIDVERKIDAIRAYQSQLKSTFHGERDMAARVRAYHRAVAEGEGFAERIWYCKPSLRA